MDAADLRRLLDGVAAGDIDPDDAAAALRWGPVAEVAADGNARLDHLRGWRSGLPEAVYGPGKTPDQCATFVADLLQRTTGPVLLTRANEAQVAAAADQNPGAEVTATAAPVARPEGGIGAAHSIVTWRAITTDESHGDRRPAAGSGDARAATVAVLTAGTSDVPVADECAAVLRAHGFKAPIVTDVGVAGLHRLLAASEVLDHADIVVVVAGMEGALASVVGGLTPAPVIAVPTSTGYGTSFEGVTALLGMLSSCASGLTVVGIDNGYGAACAALRILGGDNRGILGGSESQTSGAAL